MGNPHGESNASRAIPQPLVREVSEEQMALPENGELN